ncbi:UPF0481 protein At3g47200-like [Magnolia sinica]|uniref:UPF0481 protein At3g47200-like n=1 Tax=Magnolia sinica TaxID=86752 RepID=UPI002659FD6B|nr:UPF0481 protein At3g47200-like [Magnolia sinica]
MDDNIVMDDKKMSCGQEVGMSSGGAPMPSLHENECTMLGEASGNSLIEPLLSPDGPVLPMSSAEAHVHPRRKAMVGCAAGYFTTKSVTPSVSLPTIYKVPERIRQANKDAFEPYEPQIVSIGPYHHLKKEEFEKHKKLYQKSILSRNPNHLLEDYNTAIEKLENEARSCYSEDVRLNGSEFVKMMVLDGCFIVELFLRAKEEKFEGDDPVFSTISTLPLIRYDMLLLENQIPFSVLQVIYEKASPGNGSLVEIALDFFEPIIPKSKENKIEVSNDQINGRYFHLLHLFYSYLMPTPREKSKKCKILMFLCSKGSNEAELPISNNRSPPIKNEAELSMIPCAAELQLAGVKFKKKKDFSSILDVEFSGGVFKIPQLCIDDNTNTLLRNLVALEQLCYPRVTFHFTNYVGFMDCLVNTSKDVALLRCNGIIDNLSGSNEDVACLFNQLCSGIFVDFENNYLSGIYKDVDKYYNTPWNMGWNKCWGNLRSGYFSNPWVGLSSVAGAIVILLTIAQGLYNFLHY